MPLFTGQPPKWLPRVRDDQLSFADWNDMRSRYRFVEGQNFQQAHILDGAYTTHCGEHNEANVPREVANIHSSAIAGGKYSSLASHPATGDYRLSFSGYLFSTLWDAPAINVQTTPMSENGATKPCLVEAYVAGANDIRLFPKYLTSALGAGNTWAAEDGNLAYAIHGTPRNYGAALTLGGQRARGDTLQYTDVNYLAQATADLWFNYGVEHSQSTGVHASKVVPKSWAYVTWNGASAYTARLSDPNNPVASVVRPGSGHVQVNFTNAWTLPLQPFFGIDFPRTSGGSPSKYYLICAPYSLQTTTRVELYIYSYDGTNWAVDNTDFFLTVFAA